MGAGKKGTGRCQDCGFLMSCPRCGEKLASLDRKITEEEERICSEKRQSKS